MPHATVPSPGLQALIFCGPGVSLNTFTSNPSDLPKALVPIANRPMLWYSLDFCHRMGITDITLITPPESEPPIKAALNTNPALTALPNPKPEILAPADLLLTTGTAEILRLPEVQKCIKSDFVILPCDLISELPGTEVLQSWLTLNDRSRPSANQRATGGIAVYYPTQGLDTISHKKDETDFIATVKLPAPPVPPSEGSIRSQIEQLVMVMPTDTLRDVIEDDKGKILRLRASLFQKFPNVKLRLKHRDAHFYILPEWIKHFITSNTSFESIAEDVLGWWAKAGWQAALPRKLALDDVINGKPQNSLDESVNNLDDDVDASALSTTKTAFRPKRGSHVLHSAGGSDNNFSLDLPPILAFVQPLPSSSNNNQALIRRVDTAHQLLNVSLYLAKQATDHILSHEHKVHPSAQTGQQSRVSSEDSLIGENVTLGARVNIKECVIGANCEIGATSRLTRCLLMDGVRVGEGVQLTGCIVGRRARIEGTKIAQPGNAPENLDGAKKQRKKGGDNDDRTKLTDCEVAPGLVVEAGTEAKGEKLMTFDTEGLSEGDSAESDGGDNQR